jgi:hypothetical protein
MPIAKTQELFNKRQVGHKRRDNTMLYVQIDEKLFKDWNDNFITRVAHNVQETLKVTEVRYLGTFQGFSPCPT